MNATKEEYHQRRKRRRKRRRFLAVAAVVTGLVLILLYLNIDPIVAHLYRNRYFADAFDRTTTGSGHQPRILNFDFSLRDMEYFNSFPRLTYFEAGKRQTVDLNIGGQNYSVDLMPFKSYFKEIKINKTKNAFCVHFPPGNPLDSAIRQFDLFRTKEADFYEQELIYMLGRRLGLYIPKTDYVNIYINYVDHGDYVLKQSFDDVFLEENNIPDSVIFMVKVLKSGELDLDYLYNPDPSRLTEAHLRRFPQLLSERDSNLLLKYFDLDYIARFEALRRILKAQQGFVLDGNLRYIYNKVNGKLYPLLDESNIANMLSEDPPSRNVEFLQKQILRHPLVKKKRNRYIRQLAGAYKNLIEEHRAIKRKYKQLTGNLYYQARIKLVSSYFNRHVYRRLKKEAAKKKKKKQDGADISAADLLENRGKSVRITRPSGYLDQILLAPHLFIKKYKNLDMKFDETKDRIILEPGNYTLDETVIVPSGYHFLVKAGTSLRLAPGVSLVSYSPLSIKGTAKQPIVIAALDAERPFGAVAVMGSAGSDDATCVIEYLDFSGGSKAFIHGVKHSGGLNIHNIGVHMRQSSIHHNTRNNGLVIKKGRVLLEYNSFYANYSDQLALEFCKGLVRDNRFYDTGGALSGDGVSIKNSQIFFRDNQFENLADKGVSVGKSAEAVFYNNTFSGNRTAISARDRGIALALSNRFTGNHVAVGAYQREFPKGGGNIFLLANTSHTNQYLYKIDAFSKCYLLGGSGLLAASIESKAKKNLTAELFDTFDKVRNTYIYKSNPIERFVIGGTPASIDPDHKVVLVDLPKGAAVTQQLDFSCRLENTGVFIEPLAYGILKPRPEERKQTQLENNRAYDFKEYIFRGRLNLVHGYQVDTYELIVTSGGLPILEIDTTDRAGYPVEIVNEPKIPCKIRILRPLPKAGAVLQPDHINRILEARIEGRGQKWAKWKYGVTFDKRVTFDSMNKSKRWVLESCYVEKTLMRPKIAFDLFDKFRQPHWKRIAPQSRHVEVIVNGDYQGVYLLMEHIDRDFLALQDFDKNESHNALLYRAKNKNANFSRYNNPDSLRKKGYEDVVGGIQPIDKERDPIRGWASGFAQRHPNPGKYGEYWGILKDFSTFVAYSTDEEFENRIAELLDIDRFINMWILIQLVDDADGLYQNRYMVREKGREGKWYFVPWDKDGTLGRDYKMEKRSWAVWLRSNLFNRCMKIYWFREAFKNTWDNLLTNGAISTGTIFKMIDENAAILADAQKRNFRRWSTHPADSPYPDNNTFEQEIEYIKEWIKNRVQFLYNRILRIHNPENI
jgi:spore coat protein CotH